MTNAPIRIVVLLACLTLAGIIVMQVYLVNQAVSSQEQQFNHTVQLALRNVVESVCEVTGVDVPTTDPIDQVSSNYFIVRTNNKIDLGALEYHLTAELQKHQVDQDFEYGVYDCQSERMIYGDFVSLTASEVPVTRHKLPALEDYDYYFGVYFPDKTQTLLWGIDWWKYTSSLTLLIMVFFAYTLFVILKQKRLSSIQRDFVNNITHEFKTPLATLKVASEVINEGVEGPRLKKYTDIIAHEVSRLEGQVSLLLKSALVQEQHKIRLIPVNISTTTADLISRMDTLSENRQINLNSAPDVEVMADPYLLETVIYNLLDNARKYGGDIIKVTISKKQRLVELSVWDSGPGIPREDRKKVFQKFFRGQKSDRHDVKGFGLGLYVVKEAVKKMKGNISLHCQDGCKFEITLKSP